MVHSALCTRVLLNLRKAASRTSGLAAEDFSKRTTLRFDHGTGPMHSLELYDDAHDSQETLAMSKFTPEVGSVACYEDCEATAGTV